MKELSLVVLALRSAGLHAIAQEIKETVESPDNDGTDNGNGEPLQARRELKKKAIDVAATIRDSMAGMLKEKLSPDMVEGATLDVTAVMEMVTGELDRIEDKLAKGIWDAMDAATQDWGEKEKHEEPDNDVHEENDENELEEDRDEV